MVNKKAESRKQKAESRKQKAENCSNYRFDSQQSANKNNCELYNGKRESRNKQNNSNWKRCCYLNYKKVEAIDVKIAKSILARDYKGFSSGFEYSNGVIELWITLNY